MIPFTPSDKSVHIGTDSFWQTNVYAM